MEKEHIEILLEDMQSKLELVLEGHAALEKKIDRNREEAQEKFDMLAYMIESLQKKNGEFQKRFDGVDQRFDAVDQRFESMDQRFDAVDQRFDSLEHRFDKLEAGFAKHRANTEIHAGYTVNEEQKGHEYQ
jgi:predicted nuclease with TOPRIM domain